MMFGARMLERSYGVIPVFWNGQAYEYVLVQHRDGHWGFPKGRPEAGEAPLESARRELAEELSITQIDILESEPLESRYTFERDGAIWDKIVTFYVGVVATREARPQMSELLGYRWVSADEARGLMFENERRLVDEAEKVLGSAKRG